jgi:hypothetical protein
LKKSKKFKFHPPSTYKYCLRSKKLKNSKLVVYFIYHILNFSTIVFSIFVIQKINSKMVKCGMVVLTWRKNTDVAMA